MLPTLRAPLLLLVLGPFSLLAQVHAGDPSGVLYTTVGQELLPAPFTPPGGSLDSASVDLEGDGVLDLQFASSRTYYPDAVIGSNGALMWHAGVAVAMDATGWAAKRLEAGDVIDAGLSWRAFEEDAGNSIVMAATGSGFGGPFTIGGDAWLVDGPVATQGYLGVRIEEDGETRYGWVGLVSYVEGADSTWLRIVDMGIGDVSTDLADAPALDRISARPGPDGDILLQGPLADVRQVTVHDASGRLVRQVAAPIPSSIDLAGGAHGLYVLGLTGRSSLRTIKLAW